MPRKSAASLSVLEVVSVRRPDPPADLTAEQAEEWRAVVARMPVDWFGRETHQLLAQYSRHVARARALARQVDALDPKHLTCPQFLKRYDKLLAMAERESRAMTALARAMRITQRSRIRAETAGRASSKAGDGRRPWEFGE